MSAMFSDSKNTMVGVGTIVSSGKDYLIVGLSGNAVTMIDLDSGFKAYKATSIEAENPEWLTREEFDFMTEQFQYTFSDWSFRKFKGIK